MNYFILFYVCSNLSGNKFEGSVPEALLQKYRDGSLVLRLAYHPIHILFQHPPPPPTKKKKKDPIYCDCFLNMTKWLEEVFVHLLIRCCESDFKCIFKEKKLFGKIIHLLITYHCIEYASLGENPNLCQSVPCKKKKKKELVIPLVASSIVVLVLLFIFTALAIYRRKRRGMSSFIFCFYNCYFNPMVTLIIRDDF